jgi:hypothetical protein
MLPRHSGRDKENMSLRGFDTGNKKRVGAARREKIRAPLVGFYESAKEDKEISGREQAG